MELDLYFLQMALQFSFVNIRENISTELYFLIMDLKNILLPTIMEKEMKSFGKDIKQWTVKAGVYSSGCVI